MRHAWRVMCNVRHVRIFNCQFSTFNTYMRACTSGLWANVQTCILKVWNSEHRIQNTECRKQRKLIYCMMQSAKHETTMDMDHNATIQGRGSPTTKKDEGMKGLLVTLVTCHLSTWILNTQCVTCMTSDIWQLTADSKRFIFFSAHQDSIPVWTGFSAAAAITTAVAAAAATLTTNAAHALTAA